MPLLGGITRSGLLYEGNFTAWKSRVRAALRALPGISACLDDDIFWRRTQDEVHCAKDFLLSQVYPGLRKRVHPARRGSPSDLFHELKRFARPFRFLDLPGELRNRIYAYAMQDFTIRMRPKDNWTSGFPAITATSQSIRAETLLLCYTTCTFLIDLEEGVPARAPGNENMTATDAITICIERMGNIHLKDLRRLDFCIEIQDRDCFHSCWEATLRFSFAPATRLQLQYPERLDKATRRKLSHHAQMMEKKRVLLGLAGESMVHALLDDPGLWTFGVLRYEDPYIDSD